MNTRVLVTGATGFLGRNVLAALAARADVMPIAACRTSSTLDSGFRSQWSSLWGHRKAERTHFLEPARELVDRRSTRGSNGSCSRAPSSYGTTPPPACAARPGSGHIWTG